MWNYTQKRSALLWPPENLICLIKPVRTITLCICDYFFWNMYSVFYLFYFFKRNVSSCFYNVHHFDFQRRGKKLHTLRMENRIKNTRVKITLILPSPPPIPTPYCVLTITGHLHPPKTLLLNSRFFVSSIKLEVFIRFLAVAISIYQFLAKLMLC